MADQPGQPDPPDKWRVYEEDKTPDPEPPSEPPPVPYGSTPEVPYGAAGQTNHNLVFVTTRTNSAPKLVILIIAVAVLGVVGAAAVAIFAAVDSGISGIGGVDPKDPEDFAAMVEEIEEETGSTEVFSVGLYDGYAIVYAPVDNKSAKSIAYRWDSGGVEEWTKSTSSEVRFDLSEIDPEVIAGMCDPILEVADDVTSGDCYVSIRAPGPPFGGESWFNASASDDFGQYYSVSYDKEGVELERTVPE